ncbi:hypothetical protein JTE90_019348 [Oedothorax gibbosus]|uniref:Gustatory receptor n=1 Tax=Oedothorax gibbosus TaxID=931172 RepID=A0AAV6UKS9_9ARAC|nr:hypothetical protein JTE90_019348 [Oedothorax gibbosus]
MKLFWERDRFEESTSSTALKPSIWEHLNAIVRLLDVTGIYLTTKNNLKKQEKLRFGYFLIGFLSHVIWFTFIASEVLFCGVTKFVSSSVVTCMVSTLSISLLLWIVMLKNRKQISKLINESGRMCDSIRGNVEPKLLLCTKIGCFYIFFTPILASMGCLFSVRNNDDYFYLHCYLFGHHLESLNYYWKLFLFLIFIVIENYVLVLLPNLVTVLLFFLCEHLSCVIKTFVHKCQTVGWCGNYSWNSKSVRMVQFYGKIKKHFDAMHDLASLPIFLLLCQKFITLFFTLTVILSSKKKKILVQLIEGCFLAINALISLIVLIVAGSRLKESHGKVRSLLLEMSELSEHNVGSSVYELLPVLKTFVEKEDMVMTAAGMIPLTRSLFLKIGAALVTYGVLIVQLEA